MFLAAKMGWLPGFPVGQAEGVVHWIGVPDERGRPVERYELTRNSLHEAHLTWQTLINRYSTALPDVVDDVDRWRQGIPQYLNWLKAAAYDGQPVPIDLFALPDAYVEPIQQRAQEIKTTWPAAAGLIAALSWQTFLNPKHGIQKLNRLETNRPKLEPILSNLKREDEQFALIVSSISVID